MFIRAWLVACLVAFNAALAISAYADDEFQLNIPSLPVAEAVKTLSYQTKHSVLFQADQLGNTHTQAIDGIYSLTEALNVLLWGTGLKGGLTESGVIVVSLNKSANALSREEHMPNVSIRKTKKSLLASISAFVFGVTGSVNAQTQDAADDVSLELDEIIVTASRRSQKLQDVPMSIASVDPADFIAIGLTSLEDIIDYVPGVNFIGTGQAGQGNITMRAVSQESFIPVTAIYVDDVPLTTSTPFAFGANVFLDGLLVDLERVEIV